MRFRGESSRAVLDSIDFCTARATWEGDLNSSLVGVDKKYSGNECLLSFLSCLDSGRSTTKRLREATHPTEVSSWSYDI